MALPIRTTVGDIEAVSFYLATKPTGATSAEAKAILDATSITDMRTGAMTALGVKILADVSAD